MKQLQSFKKQLALLCIMALLLTAIPNFSYADKELKAESELPPDLAALDLASEADRAETRDGEISDEWQSINDETTGIHVAIPSDMGETEVKEYLDISGSNGQYAITSTIDNYFPKLFSMMLVSEQCSISATNGAEFKEYATIGGAVYGTVIMDKQDTVITIANSKGSITITVPAPNDGSEASTGDIYAFLPAPGQFTNEGLTNGGWGDAYVSGMTETKAMVNNIAQTGVSLGFFGGSIVLDYSENPIQNDPKNPYGVDFILYGNAFKGNAEPGCVQVSEDGETWYDIAGSLYDDDDTDPEFELTYMNPVPADDADSFDYGHKGTDYYIDSDNRIDVPYTGSKSGSVASNSWHHHAYFPLFVNYFKGVNNDAALARVDELSFVDYNKNTTNGSTLTLRGVMLGSATNTATANYQYGYCDVHPNGNQIGVVYNPLTADENSVGGDPIDIDWAVDEVGDEVELEQIKYIRVYTGAAAMNGPFGEISTEVTGSYDVEPDGSGRASRAAMIECEQTLNTRSAEAGILANHKVLEVKQGEEVKIVKNSDVLLINGVKVEDYCMLDTSEIGKKYRVISQSGDESPAIAMIEVVE